MRYNTYQNGTINIIVDTEKKTLIAEVYEKDVADRIVNALNAFESDLSSGVTINRQPEPQQNNTITATIGENTEIEEPEYYKTGIKIVGGVEHYKCWYKCFNCSKTGKHYIPKDVKQIHCHSCDFELPVTTATREGFPHRDDFGNFFVSKHVQSGDAKLTKTWTTSDRSSKFLS